MDEQYDARVARLTTPRECLVFERNARERGHPELGDEARARCIELSAARDMEADDAAADPLRHELWTALAACEYVLGRSSTGPRQSIRRRGLLGAGEHFARQGGIPVTLAALDAVGFRDHAWESVVMRHQEHFTDATAKRARERLEALAEIPEADAPAAAAE